MTTQPPSADVPFEIESSRVFAAPREQVFEAFANADHLPRWWGPKGFTNTFHEFDLRPGGAWRFVMHGPDGKNYENLKEFIEVQRPSRIVFRHIQTMHRFVMTMTFAEADGNTKLTWHMRFESGGGNDNLPRFVAQANEENFDRLETYLAGMS